jgi:hypothetical protein
MVANFISKTYPQRVWLSCNIGDNQRELWFEWQTILRCWQNLEHTTSSYSVAIADGKDIFISRTLLKQCVEQYEIMQAIAK